MEFLELAAIIGAAVASTLGGFFWILKIQSSLQPQALPVDTDTTNKISFLFENNSLHHASDLAAKRFRLTR